MALDIAFALMDQIVCIDKNLIISRYFFKINENLWNHYFLFYPGITCKNLAYKSWHMQNLAQISKGFILLF